MLAEMNWTFTTLNFFLFNRPILLKLLQVMSGPGQVNLWEKLEEIFLRLGFRFNCETNSTEEYQIEMWEAGCMFAKYI